MEQQKRNHIDINGKSTAIKDLTTPHLKNIIAMMERKAALGVKVESGSWGCDSIEMDYDCQIMYGADALARTSYPAYIAELKARSIKNG